MWQQLIPTFKFHNPDGFLAISNGPYRVINMWVNYTYMCVELYTPRDLIIYN